MEMVKIKDINNGAVKEVKKSLASDYVGTGRFELVKEETKEETKSKPSKFAIPKVTSFDVNDK